MIICSRGAPVDARFAARAFVVRWTRETGAELSAAVTDRMLFAYEMGHLRGRGDGMLRGGGNGDESLAMEQAKSAAVTFVARWICEAGVGGSGGITNYMLLAYEVGYLGGYGEGLDFCVIQYAALYDELERKE